MRSRLTARCLAAVISPKRLLALLLLLPLLLAALPSCRAPLAPGEGEILVHFLDVGQADCTLLQTREAVVLVDAGSDEPGRGDRIVAYLRELGIERIDCLVLTHPHSDHIGGAAAVLREFPVAECLLSALASDTPLFTELLDALVGEGCLMHEAVRGKGLTYGDITLEVLSPDRLKGENENAGSAVIFARYGESRIALTADISSEVEEELLTHYGKEALGADLLKVAHHGSSTATGADFLEALSPEYAVISCGRNNEYRYPSAEVLARLALADVTVLRTDLDGTVVLRGDGTEFSPIK